MLCLVEKNLSRSEAEGKQAEIGASGDVRGERLHGFEAEDKFASTQKQQRPLSKSGLCCSCLYDLGALSPGIRMTG